MQNRTLLAVVSFSVLVTGYKIETIAQRAVAQHGHGTPKETIGMWYLSDYAVSVLDASTAEAGVSDIDILSPLGNILDSASRLGGDMHYPNGSVAISFQASEKQQQQQQQQHHTHLIKRQVVDYKTEGSKKWYQSNVYNGLRVYYHRFILRAKKLGTRIGAVDPAKPWAKLKTAHTSVTGIVRWYLTRLSNLFNIERICYEKEVDLLDDDRNAVFNVLIKTFTDVNNCNVTGSMKEIIESATFRITEMQRHSTLSSCFAVSHPKTWHSQIRWRDSRDSSRTLVEITCHGTLDDIEI